MRGFVLCPYCARPYTGYWVNGRGGRFAYYRCYTQNCATEHRCVRADRMHAEFEKILERLRPRANIMKAVETELLDLWQRKQLDVETVRKERERKLAAIQKDIDGYAAAISHCSSPVVLRRIEEAMEALEAKKVRLGGRIERPKGPDHDFKTALKRVTEFLKAPLFMWKTGDLSQRRLVLRLVFTEPLIFDAEIGFQTPSFSLPINIACVPELDEMEVVDMVRKFSNRLREMIQEWYTQLREFPGAAC